MFINITWRLVEISLCNGNAGSSSDDQSRKATGGGWMLPSTEGARSARGMIPDNGGRTASAGTTKRVVRINIE